MRILTQTFDAGSRLTQQGLGNGLTREIVYGRQDNLRIRDVVKDGATVIQVARTDIHVIVNAKDVMDAKKNISEIAQDLSDINTQFGRLILDLQSNMTQESFDSIKVGIGNSLGGFNTIISKIYDENPEAVPDECKVWFE